MEKLFQSLMLDHIFSRLDVRSTIYCKCVCKRWRDIVMDPYIWSKKKNPSLLIHDATFNHRGKLRWIEIQEPEKEEEEEELDAVKIHDANLSGQGILNRYPDLHNIRIKVGDSVNGLVCVWDLYGTTFILNPVAREYITIPDPPSMLADTSFVVISYGFGLVSTNNAALYKVVRICRRRVVSPTSSSFQTSGETKIEVFTLGTEQWRVLKPQDIYNNVSGYMKPGVFSNGHVHWIDSKGGCELFAFDLDNETFNLFPSPPFSVVYEEEKYHGILGVIKGCLTQGCWYPSPLKFTFWVMKEYGIKDSWYQAFTINETDIARDLSNPLYIVDGLKGGVLIVTRQNKLAAYCLHTNTLKNINLSSTSDSCTVHVVNIVTAITYHPTFLKLQNFASTYMVVHTF